MRHDPWQIAQAAAAEQVVAVIAGIVVPEHVLQRQDSVAIQGVQNVLVGQNQLHAVPLHIAEERRRVYFMTSPFQIDQQHAGVEVVVFRSQPELVYAVGQFRFPGMRGGGKQFPLQIGWG